MVFVYFQLPVVAHINNPRANKTIPDDQFFEMRYMVLVFCPEYFLPKYQYTVENCTCIGSFQVVEELKDIIEETEDLVTCKFILDIPEQAVEVAHEYLLLVLHPVEVKQVKEVIEFFMKAAEGVMQLPYME